MKTQRALLALTLWLSACAPVTTTAYPAPPTTGYPAPATPTAAPSALPTTPAPPTETPQPTATEFRWSKPWRIWFEGFSCAGLSECGTFPGAPYAYFSVLSDGSGLEPLQVASLPSFSMPSGLPNSSEELLLARGLSKDGSLLAYASRPQKFDPSFDVYVANLADGNVDLIFSSPDKSDARWFVGAVCLSADMQIIRVVAMSRVGLQESPLIVYSLRRDGREAQRPIEILGLLAGGGVCSPDGDELVIGQANEKKEEAGLYRVSLTDGRYEQILASYYVWKYVLAPNESQP